MRVRTTLAAGVLAVTAILGSAGSALADNHSEGEIKGCGQYAGAIGGHAYWGKNCAEAQWMRDVSGDHYSYQ